MTSRSWSIGAVVLAAGLSFAVVGRASEPGELVGAWFSDACILELRFNADGTFIHEDGAARLNGTWRLEGAALTLTYSDNGKQESGTFANGALSVTECDFTRS